MIGNETENIAKPDTEHSRRICMAILESNPEINIFALDSNYRYLTFNSRHKEAVRKVWGKEITVGMNILEVIGRPDSRRKSKAAFDRALSGERFSLFESYGHEARECFYWQSFYSPIRSGEGAVIGLACFIQNITERVKAENKLRESEEKYRLIAENISDVIWVLNLTRNRFTYVSPSVFQLRGLSPEEAVKESVEDALTPESLKEARKVIGRSTADFIRNPNVSKAYKHEFEQPCKDGKTVWVEVSVRYRYNSDGELELVGASHDIRKRKKAEERILHIINHDQLTDLYNRRYFEAAVRKADTEANLPITLIIVDVNGLKLINDAFGNTFGDSLLKRIANLIKRECGSEEIVSRIGGDEFILLLLRTGPERANRLIERIRAAIENVKYHNVVLSVAIGSATKKDAAVDLNKVYKEAEDELYRHKLSESSSMRSRTIELIMNSLFEKNKREMLHSQRVGKLCAEIAKIMNFSKDKVNQMRLAGLMHDIGKIGVRDTILNKEGALNHEEWEQIKRHSEIGYRILSSANEFSEIANYVLEHQERWDGSGYPKGLKKEEISLQARIIAVADAYDAMTSDRTYRRGRSEEDAVNEIMKFAGIQFDPKVAKVLVEKVLGEAPLK